MCLILARRLDVSEEELPLAAVAVKNMHFLPQLLFFKKRVMALKTQNKKLLFGGYENGQGSERSGRW